ncbi:MAG: S8 family serine peptidase, partial [Pseudomonadota bacterium]
MLYRFRRGLVLFGALGLLGCVPSLRPTAELLDPREVIALIPIDGARADFRRAAEAQGFVPLETVSLPALGERMVRFAIPPALDGAAAIAALEALQPEVTAGLNHIYKPAEDTARSRFDYADTLMRWPDGGCRALGPVGMLDTAVAAEPGARVVARSFLRDARPETRHGSDVASVLLDRQRVSGAVVYAAGVVGRGTDGAARSGVDSLLKGLDWLQAEGIRVVNVSLTGPYNKLLDRGMAGAVARGMVIVAAAGNDGAAAPPRYPAALDAVIAVTAVDTNREVYRQAVRGAHIDVSAPGVDIRGGGADGVRVVTGTSMAVRFVTARSATDPELFGH